MLRTVYASAEAERSTADRQAAMLVATTDEYGPPADLGLRPVPRVEPDSGQVLIRVAATTVNPADWHILRGEPYVARLQIGLRRPKFRVLGCEVAGTVEAVGSEVDGFTPGDEVIASTFMRGFGGFAELAMADQDMVVHKPTEVSMAEAATLPLAGCTALQALRDHARVEAGQRVLIIGASGGVGSFAVQVARHLGAEVTGVCSGRNRELVQTLGAAHVIDYTTDDPMAAGVFDVVLHLAGDHPLGSLRKLTTRNGTMLTLSGDAPGRWLGPAKRAIAAVVLNPFVSQRMGAFTVTPSVEDIGFLVRLVASGEIHPVIDRTYRLNQLDEALTYLETGRARGKVIVTP